jgi:hypothetical protein
MTKNAIQRSMEKRGYRLYRPGFMADLKALDKMLKPTGLVVNMIEMMTGRHTRMKFFRVIQEPIALTDIQREMGEKLRCQGYVFLGYRNGDSLWTTDGAGVVHVRQTGVKVEEPHWHETYQHWLKADEH